MHRFDRQHVDAAKHVFDMDNGCDSDGNQLSVQMLLAVDAENNVQVFVFIADQRLVESVLDDREDAYPLARLIGGRWFAINYLRQCAKIFKSYDPTNAVASSHAHINPARCLLGCGDKVTECGQARVA